MSLKSGLNMRESCCTTSRMSCRRSSRHVLAKSHSRVKAGLVSRKEHYLLVLQLLSALHRSDNCCINSIAAVLVHVLDHLLLFVHHRQGDLSTGANLSGLILRQSIHSMALHLGTRSCQGVP